MSLQALPTELDLEIIENLDRDSQSQVTQASKYYRRTGLPVLHKQITLYNNEDWKIKLLLTTLLCHDDLRHLVKKFILLDSDEDDLYLPNLTDNILFYTNEKATAVSDLLWSQDSAVRDAIVKMCVHHRFQVELRAVWFAKISDPYPLFDGHLALVLCLRQAIE